MGRRAGASWRRVRGARRHSSLRVKTVAEPKPHKVDVSSRVWISRARVRVAQGSRSRGQVIQCPPPRPLPTSKPSISTTSMPASRYFWLLWTFFE